ncbi:MAG TPA: SDR family oxidoreductase [Lacipirellulaceae bacterium]|jgi:3-oxoacyl-[acyl-carrier protein] reductase|nr:SDR family oxidoreductase [Lacipirellulaceae bacterium]
MPEPIKDLSGRTAVVTGSSSGIGRAIALELAQAGADILVHTRKNASGAEETAAQVRTLGASANVLLADLADPAAQDRFVRDAWEWRAADIWVNNAGADVLTGNAAYWSFEEKLTALWQVDVVATLRLSRAAGDLMSKRGNGVILNIGWDQAETGMAGDSGQMFAAIKGAVMATTRSLAKSLAPDVRVNCVAPGWIQTNWGHQASDVWQQIAVGDSLMQRWGQPEDVARAVRFLVSPAAEFVNGQVIVVNGGRNDSRDVNW